MLAAHQIVSVRIEPDACPFIPSCNDLLEASNLELIDLVGTDACGVTNQNTLHIPASVFCNCALVTRHLCNRNFYVAAGIRRVCRKAPDGLTGSQRKRQNVRLRGSLSALGIDIGVIELHRRYHVRPCVQESPCGSRAIDSRNVEHQSRIAESGPGPPGGLSEGRFEAAAEGQGASGKALGWAAAGVDAFDAPAPLPPACAWAAAKPA